MPALRAERFRLVNSLPAFLALLLAHLVRTVTSLAVRADSETGAALYFRTQLGGVVMACVAVDVVCKLVVQVFCHLFAAFGDGRRWHRRALGNISALEVTFATALNFLIRSLPRSERQNDLAL